MEPTCEIEYIELKVHLCVFFFSFSFCMKTSNRFWILSRLSAHLCPLSEAPWTPTMLATYLQCITRFLCDCSLRLAGVCGLVLAWHGAVSWRRRWGHQRMWDSPVQYLRLSSFVSHHRFLAQMQECQDISFHFGKIKNVPDVVLTVLFIWTDNSPPPPIVARLMQESTCWRKIQAVVFWSNCVCRIDVIRCEVRDEEQRPPEMIRKHHYTPAVGH